MDHSEIALNTRKSRSFGATGTLELVMPAKVAPSANRIGAATAVYFLAEEVSGASLARYRSEFSPAIPKTIGASRPGVSRISCEVAITVNVARKSGNCCTLRAQ